MKAHPWVLRFTPNSFYSDSPILDSVELSTPSQKDREAWLLGLRTSSVKVAKLFRKTHDYQAHAHEVDHLQTGAAIEAVRGTDGTFGKGAGRALLNAAGTPS